MPIVPHKPAEKITWFEAHEDPFTTNAVAIGTTAAAVSALVALTTAARAKQVAQAAAQEAARTATNEYKDAVAAMAQAGSDILKAVKAKAAAVGGNSVFNLAQIPPPATPSPVGPPGTPTAFKVMLNPDGSLELTWKCSNPTGAGGTIYQVSRKVGTGAGGNFEIIGGSGQRKFVDATVPAAVASVTYRIRANRSTVMGTANDFTVNFGVGGGGEMIASVASASPRMAA
ncbi:MAG: hypothetical protein QOF78_4081 [Phycisphaerales bacterium]|nr:hypothetical protein [Phycisphaerales bacterium]